MHLTVEDLFLITFVLVDDWYQENHPIQFNRTLKSKKIHMFDSEILTLALSMDFFEFTSERRYIHFIRCQYFSLFPNLLDHSQYNRRLRNLSSMLERLRLSWNLMLQANLEKHFILDTTPVVAIGYRRDKRKSEFLGSANYGHCAARRMKYFGYKLVLLSTLEGVTSHFELVPANLHENNAAEHVLQFLKPGSTVIGDKGFIGEDWQKEMAKKGITLLTPRQKNQKQQFPSQLTQFINRLRSRIEGVYKLLKEGGRSVEHTLAHTVEGLVIRVLAKITSLTLRALLRKRFTIDYLRFSFIS